MTGVTDVPAGLPVAWSNASTGTPESGSAARLRATTTHPDRRSSSRRTGRRALSAVHGSLSARDWQVVRGVRDHRYLTTVQLQAFYFPDHATDLTAARVCRRVLRRLLELRVIDHLDRRVGGVRAGSASFVWQLGPVGDRLLRETEEGSRVRRHEPGLLFLDHCLAVADAHLALVTAARRGDLELVEAQTEPDCWRPYTGLGGARLSLQPDLYAVTGDPADPDFVNQWFIEVDRGTEHPKRLLKKCSRYEDYRRTGTEQANSGSFPLVVWVMRDNQQAERFRAAIHADKGLDDRLYRVTTPDGFYDVIRGGAS